MFPLNYRLLNERLVLTISDVANIIGSFYDHLFGPFDTDDVFDYFLLYNSH